MVRAGPGRSGAYSQFEIRTAVIVIGHPVPNFSLDLAGQPMGCHALAARNEEKGVPPGFRVDFCTIHIAKPYSTDPSVFIAHGWRLLNFFDRLDDGEHRVNLIWRRTSCQGREFI